MLLNSAAVARGCSALSRRRCGLFPRTLSSAASAQRSNDRRSLESVSSRCCLHHRYRRTVPPSHCAVPCVSVWRSTSTRRAGGGVSGTHFKDDTSTRRSLPLGQPRAPRSSTSSGNRSGNFSSGSGRDGLESDSAVLRMLGPRWSPYGRLARIDKPAGTLLLLFPCWWSIALAAPIGTLPDAKLMALFATGSVLMRSAGCTINDLWDKDFDRKVTRTKQRPLASGELGNTQAIAFLGAQLTLGLGVLLSLNIECIKLGFAVMPLVVAYPLMKRYTDWPQAVLGLTFNWGAIMGWAAVHGSASWEHVLPLYGAGVCWTLVYDTLYGHQDKADDKRLGIRSTALLFGDRTKPILAGFGTASVGLLTASGVTAELSWPFFAGTAAAGGHLAWQIYSADLEDPAGLFKIFKSNQNFGALVFASIVCGHF
ncbi:unnamed protein product [Ectocarpus sp. 12 AP-2014]